MELNFKTPDYVALTINNINKKNDEMIFTYKLEIRKETEKAVLVYMLKNEKYRSKNKAPLGYFNGQRKYEYSIWLPKTQIKDIIWEEKRVIIVPKWLLAENTNIQRVFGNSVKAKEILNSLENGRD